MSAPESTEALEEDCFVQEIAYVPESDTTCTLCYAEFLDVEDLEIHKTQMHYDFTVHTCQLCPVKYRDLVKYAIHFRDNHLSEATACSFCSKVFLDTKLMLIHQKKHVNPAYKKLYSCSQCEAGFNSTLQLELHEAKYHDNVNDGVVLKCVKELSSLMKLKVSAVLQTRGGKIFVCVYCDFTSVDLAAYIHHVDEGNCRVYICDKCSHVTSRKYFLQTHVLNRKNICNELIEEINCEFCKEKICVTKIFDHVKNCNLSCGKCNMKFDNVEELSAHQKRHPETIRNVICCKYCRKELVGDIALQRHIVNAHKDLHLYKYKCVTCGSVFQHPHKLFVHYFSSHKDLEPFTCKVCDKKFRLRKQFTLHIKLVHKSIGFVEFDDNYHVYFTDTKSETPFVPKCVVEQCDLDIIHSSIDNSAKITENKNPKRVLKRKAECEIDLSDDEPLVLVKKKLVRKSQKRRNSMTKLIQNKKKMATRKRHLTCTVCQKYCYTYQNYKNHMSLHKKNEKISCVKCSETFSSRDQLESHMENEHSSSKLTETLKKILEKRKLFAPQKNIDDQDDNVVEMPKELSKTEKFLRTLKKVDTEISSVPATITIAPKKGLSVQKFLEDFTPETNEAKLQISTHITIKNISNHPPRPPAIKLKKFEPFQENPEPKLKMPERFKPSNDEKATVKIKLLLSQIVFTKNNLFDNDNTECKAHYVDVDRSVVPEVAQEVMLEGTDDTAKSKIALKPLIDLLKWPKNTPKLHVATLQPEAPYYKIIKLDSKKKEKAPPPIIKDKVAIKLKDGTKLVNTNPLAHLIGDKSIEDIIKPIKRKYYKPAISDYQEILAKALMKLEKQDDNILKGRKKRTK